MSSNVPNLSMACFFNNKSIFSFGTFLIKSVLIGVGPTALTVILKFASSRDIISVRDTTAALEAAYIASPSSFNGVATVEKLMILPYFLILAFFNFLLTKKPDELI